ncbi:hypothetical protein GCM10025771_41180 [Niveibacterium umoris]
MAFGQEELRSAGQRGGRDWCARDNAKAFSRDFAGLMEAQVAVREGVTKGHVAKPNRLSVVGGLPHA